MSGNLLRIKFLNLCRSEWLLAFTVTVKHISPCLLRLMMAVVVLTIFRRIVHLVRRAIWQMRLSFLSTSRSAYFSWTNIKHLEAAFSNSKTSTTSLKRTTFFTASTSPLEATVVVSWAPILRCQVTNFPTKLQTNDFKCILIDSPNTCLTVLSIQRNSNAIKWRLIWPCLVWKLATMRRLLSLWFQTLSHFFSHHFPQLIWSITLPNIPLFCEILHCYCTNYTQLNSSQPNSTQLNYKILLVFNGGQGVLFCFIYYSTNSLNYLYFTK